MTILGGRVTLSCTFSTTTSDVVLTTEWLLDGTPIEEQNIDVSTGGETLVIASAPAAFNRSEIKCVVQLASGISLTSGGFLLQIQGTYIYVQTMDIANCNNCMYRDSNGC